MRERPSTARSLRRRLAPFVAADLLGFVLLAVSAHVDLIEYLTAAAATVAVAGLVHWEPRVRLPVPVQARPALLLLASVGLLRDAAGGQSSGVGMLALLPVFWIALYGGGGEMATVLAGLASFYIAPIVFIGGVAYPASGYRTAVLSVAVGGIIGFTVQRLVEQVRADSAELEGHKRDLQRVAAVSRQIATSADARFEVCRAACEISDATFAVLLEPQGADRLVSTAMAGLDAGPFAAAGRRSAPMIAFASREPLLIPDAASSSLLNARLWAEHGSPATMLFEPVLRGDAVSGVLVVGWHRPIATHRVPAVVSLLAAEAAIAIERADLV
jgi:K+-sensing histidine kinase KdpD